MAYIINRLVYLDPLFPSEEAEGHQRISHVKPVDNLLNHIKDKLHDGHRSQIIKKWTILYHVPELSLDYDDNKFHLEAY